MKAVSGHCLKRVEAGLSPTGGEWPLPEGHVAPYGIGQYTQDPEFGACVYGDDRDVGTTDDGPDSQPDL